MQYARPTEPLAGGMRPSGPRTRKEAESDRLVLFRARSHPSRNAIPESADQHSTILPACMCISQRLVLSGQIYTLLGSIATAEASPLITYVQVGSIKPTYHDAAAPKPPITSAVRSAFKRCMRTTSTVSTPVAAFSPAFSFTVTQSAPARRAGS